MRWIEEAKAHRKASLICQMNWWLMLSDVIFIQLTSFGSQWFPNGWMKLHISLSRTMRTIAQLPLLDHKAWCAVILRVVGNLFDCISILGVCFWFSFLDDWHLLFFVISETISTIEIRKGMRLNKRLVSLDLLGLHHYFEFRHFSQFQEIQAISWV